ncbi:mechanosensitive ion channel family protein [Halococcoides cellulosivorans]|uniref:Mechanosensitive ion channel protein n=1 Tax=Halococcoides cellulosivorans TaxID=1679096 RepID=A0A2R4X2P0_9EURY|nr:mechanosensitive ion channel family protein [Halococcoides cellulosivorans]AWB28060.1 mechanosensitive ion channel protein [Halococcoides cellulosivorans]
MSVLDTNVTAGPIGQTLDAAGLPYAAEIGSALTFFAVFVALVIVGRAVVAPAIGRVLQARNLDAHARKPLIKLVNIAVLFVAVAVAFGLAGFGSFLQSLATIAAAGTLAIGFALQDVMKNLAAGVFIFTDRPFRIGDWIEWDDYSGRVEDISLRVTRVRTFDNELLTVPNSHLTDGVIKNPVDADRLRVKVDFGIGYDDDIDAATDIVLDEAEAHPDVLATPDPSVRVTELGDSSVVLQSRVWIGDPSRSDVVRIRGEYTASVKERFDDAGIDIPYPNRTVSGGLTVEGAAFETE